EAGARPGVPSKDRNVAWGSQTRPLPCTICLRRGNRGFAKHRGAELREPFIQLSRMYHGRRGYTLGVAAAQSLSGVRTSCFPRLPSSLLRGKNRDEFGS